MAGFNWTIHEYDHLDSTQTYARNELAAGQANEGTVIQAARQTDGYGRHKRVWTGGQGNLLMSFILKPACTAQESVQFSFITSLALTRAIEDLAGKSDVLKLKWPNDVMLGNKKCAGILIEAESDAEGRLTLIIGLGVNLASAPDMGAALYEAYGYDHNLSVKALREMFLAHFETLYHEWHQEGWDAIRLQWLEHSYAVGQTMIVKVRDLPCEGAFHGLSKDGSLQLKLDDGRIKTISSGDVFVE